MYNQVVYFTLQGLVLFMRNIFIREQVEIVHGHSAFSVMAHEALSFCRVMGIPVSCKRGCASLRLQPSSLLTQPPSPCSALYLPHVAWPQTVFTDHSLFGFGDASSIWTNKLLKYGLMDSSHVICVSHTRYASCCITPDVERHARGIHPRVLAQQGEYGAEGAHPAVQSVGDTKRGG